MSTSSTFNLGLVNNRLGVLSDQIGDEVTARANADTALNNRISAIGAISENSTTNVTYAQYWNNIVQLTLNSGRYVITGNVAGSPGATVERIYITLRDGANREIAYLIDGKVLDQPIGCSAAIVVNIDSDNTIFSLSMYLSQALTFNLFKANIRAMKIA